MTLEERIALIVDKRNGDYLLSRGENAAKEIVGLFRSGPTITVISVECEMESNPTTDRVGFGTVSLPHPVSPGNEYSVVLLEES